jgi:hypothetical protein
VFGLRGSAATVSICVGLCLALTACGGDGDGPVAGGRSTSPGTPSTPFQGTTIALGEVKAVDALDGMRLRQVNDGDIRSFQLIAKVLETGETDQFGSGSNAYKAEGDAKLLGFSVSAKRSTHASDDKGTQVVAAVTVDGTTRTLPDFKPDKTLNYLLAVPKDRQVVDFELKFNTVVQRFDLLQGVAKGDRPAALYRARDETALYQEALTPATFMVAATGNKVDSTYVVQPSQAALGYFNVLGGQVPSDPDKAWLTVWTTSDVKPYGICNAPLGGYKLTDKQGKEYTPVVAASKIADTGLLSNDTPSLISFEVPSDLDAATLTVAPTEVPCEVSTATVKPVAAQGAAKIEVTFPKN